MYSLIRILLCLCLLAGSASAKNIYFAENAQGTDTGLSSANAHSRTWFETPANWGAGGTQISPGDTVHIVGTISGLFPQASGTSGNVTTILWEPGAKVSTVHTDCCYVVGLSYMVFDGGTNGIVECTANGTHLANQSVVFGFHADNVSHVTFQNLTIRNLYIHSNDSAGLADAVLTSTYVSGIYMNGYGPAVLIQNCNFSDIQWCINCGGGTGGFLTVTGNTFVNYDHGIGGVGGGGGILGFTVTNNHFGSTACWDTTSNSYHHDGIHTYWATGTGGISNGIITGNLFDGDWGTHNTAYIFMEGDYNNHLPAEAPNWLLANNVFVEYSGNWISNGFVVFIGNSGVVANNTFLGAGTALQQAISTTGTNIVFKNNLISGVNRFVDSANAYATGGLNNNIYTNLVGSGNTPFRYTGSDVASFAAWKTASGQDSASSNPSTMTINSDGTLPSGSAAIDAGTSTGLSGIYSTDKIGTTRPQGSAWDVGAYEYTGADTTPPTLVSASVATNGNNVIFNFSETVQFGAGGNAGWTTTASGGAVTLTYGAGSGTSTLTYNTSRTIQYNETLTRVYTQPTHGVQDTSANDLASIVSASLTNNSTVGMSGGGGNTRAIAGSRYPRGAVSGVRH